MEEENKYINKYIDYITFERKLSKNTIESYKNDLNSLYAFKKDITNITSDDLNKYFKDKNDLNSRSIAHRHTVFNNFFEFLIEENIINKNPMENISMPKTSKKLPNYLNEEEIYKLLDIKLTTPYDYRNKAMLEVMYATGLRVSELINLKISEIDFDNCFLRVVGKGNKERIVPLNDTSIKYLKIYIEMYRNEILKNYDSEYLFISNAHTKITRQAFFKFIKLECKKKGINKNVSPHVIRHSFASVLLKNGANIRIIQELLGHEDISTTQIYTHLINEKIKKDYEDYHPRSHKN